MSDIMTAEQAFNYAMNFYPTLYASDSLDSAKFKFYDQTFNVIGNGFNNLTSFLEVHDITGKENFLEEFPSKYIGSHLLFEGFTKTYSRLRTLTDGTHRTITLGDNSSALNELYTRQEQEDHPEIIHWVPIQKIEPIPFPNFSKEYSLAWEMDIDKLDISWTEAALWYYSKAKEFFNSEHAHLYSNAWPQDELKQKALIDEYNLTFEHYKKEDYSEQEWHTTISEIFGLEFTGDTKAFIQKRWDIELTRIHDFLDETIDHLTHKFTTRKIQQLREEFNPSEDVDKCTKSLTI